MFQFSVRPFVDSITSRRGLRDTLCSPHDVHSCRPYTMIASSRPLLERLDWKDDKPPYGFVPEGLPQPEFFSPR